MIEKWLPFGHRAGGQQAGGHRFSKGRMYATKLIENTLLKIDYSLRVDKEK